jgi:hypothetical protein
MGAYDETEILTPLLGDRGVIPPFSGAGGLSYQSVWGNAKDGNKAVSNPIFSYFYRNLKTERCTEQIHAES